MNTEKPKSQQFQVLAENRKARHNYTIEDTFECGIVLQGAEVKSLRDGKFNFADSYAYIRSGEIFLIGFQIERFIKSTHEILDPSRTRKLLLHKKEIRKIEKILQIKKASLVPLKLYLKNGRIKVLIGLGFGKTKIDKRESIKEKTVKRELARVLKRG
jgi:SsrA-binding protein